VVAQTGLHFLITIFKHVEDVERIQRRQYHRVDSSIPTFVTPVTREELDRLSQGKAAMDDRLPGVRGYVVNISGAGFALAAKAALKPSDLLYLELATDEEYADIPVIGKILNVTQKKTTGEFLMHAEFVGLSSDTHEKIFRFIYSQIRQELQPLS